MSLRPTAAGLVQCCSTGRVLKAQAPRSCRPCVRPCFLCAVLCRCLVKWFYRPEDPGITLSCQPCLRAHWLALVGLSTWVLLTDLQSCALSPCCLAAGIPGGRKAFHGERELYKR